MNYNDKKKENIDLDELDIKSHLNTSLDLNGISVSEDLINRTLEAIRRQPTELVNEGEVRNAPDKEGKKLHSWNRYVRGFAGVAAAALILVGGYQLLDNLHIGNSKSDSNTELSAGEEYRNYDKSAQIESAENGTLAAKGDAEDTSNSLINDSQDMASTADSGYLESKEDGAATGEAAVEPQFSIATDSLTNAKVGNYYGGAVDEAESEKPNTQMNTELTEILTFRDIFLADPEQAEYITLTDEVKKSSITLTAKDEILEFYTVMDKHQFTQNTEAAEDQNYSVEISNPQKDALFTMIIGNYVTVNYQDVDVSSQSLYYAQDIELLKQDLQAFFDKYIK